MNHLSNSPLHSGECSILCVENDADSCELIATTLELANEGYLIETTTSALRAVELVNIQPYDLYILDSWMPEMNGADLCRWIRSTGSTSPIIFYSGAVFSTDKELAMDAGADEYLLKPDDIYRIEEVVANCLQRSSSPSCQATAA